MDRIRLEYTSTTLESQKLKITYLYFIDAMVWSKVWLAFVPHRVVLNGQASFDTAHFP